MGKRKIKVAKPFENQSAIDKAFDNIVRERFNLYKFLFGDQRSNAEVSTGQVWQFSISVVAITALISTFLIALADAGNLSNPWAWLLLGGLSLGLMELYFWVFDNTKPVLPEDAMSHTVVRKLWNFTLAVLTVFTLGGAAVLGKKLATLTGRFWLVYGAFITKLVLWTLFWILVLGAAIFLLWLFIKLNSLKYKPKRPEPPSFEELNEQVTDGEVR